LRRGQSIVVQTTGIASRVRTIQNHHREVDEAHPGSRVALNLPDLEPASGRSAREANTVARGDVVTLAELGIATMAIDVQLERAKRAGEAATSIRPLKHGSIVWIHHGSAATAARVHLHGRGTLQAGDCGLARLQLQSPAFIFIGDCFVIRDWPEQHTLAGGVVIDINRDGSPRDAQERTMLEARAANPGDARLAVESQITRDGITAQDKLLVQSRFSTDEITKAVSNLACENKVVIAGTNVIDAQFWSRARDVATKTVDHFHCEHPEKPGLNLTDLRKALEDIGAAEFMDALLAHLSADGFQRTGNVLRRTRHAPALPPRLQAAGEKLRKILKSRAFDPPSRKELAPDPISEQALRFLIINHEAIEIAPDIVMNSDAFLQGIAIVRGHLQRNGAATVSELKSALASSRRIMVPFLEKLDRDGITRREGDVRRLLGPAKVEATGASGRQ
jgi:selenocysteine-specific elongation factor